MQNALGGFRGARTDIILSLYFHLFLFLHFLFAFFQGLPSQFFSSPCGRLGWETIDRGLLVNLIVSGSRASMSHCCIFPIWISNSTFGCLTHYFLLAFIQVTRLCAFFWLIAYVQSAWTDHSDPRRTSRPGKSLCGRQSSSSPAARHQARVASGRATCRTLSNAEAEGRPRCQGWHALRSSGPQGAYPRATKVYGAGLPSYCLGKRMVECARWLLGRPPQVGWEGVVEHPPSLAGGPEVTAGPNRTWCFRGCRVCGHGSASPGGPPGPDVELGCPPKMYRTPSTL